MRQNRKDAARDARARAAELARREWPWLVAIALGGLLRGFRLLDQVPVDDEWHSLHAVAFFDYGTIASSFGPVDHCIPLTLYLKLAADTVGLSDAVLRLPSLLVGMAMLFVAPWLMREHLGRRGSHVFAGLLAVSPLLVLYSRYARPYEVGALLCFVALVLCERWWRTGARRFAVGYGACAGVAAWFLPVTAPFTLAPLGALAGMALAERPASLLRRVGPPALAAVVFGAPLVGVPIWTQAGDLTAKVGVWQPDLATFGTAVGFLLGTRSPWIAALLLGLAVIGGRVLWRRAPVWTALALGGSVALVIGVLVAAPAYAWLGFVVGRYWMPALPVLLACVALGIVELTGRAPLRSAPLLACAALCALLLWTGRVPAILLDTPAWFPGRWISEMEGEVAEPRRIPDFYRRLAAEPPGSFAIAEAPWYYSLWNSLLPAYERVHRQRTLVGLTSRMCTRGHPGEYPPDSGIDLRAFVPLDEPAALRERGVRYVVFHRDLDAEMVRVIDPIAAEYSGHGDVSDCADQYRRMGWPVVYRDEAIAVFEVPDAGPRPGAS